MVLHINKLARKCGYFFNAELEQNITCNNGYNCKHPLQEKYNGIGYCYAFSCPLAVQFGDEEDELVLLKERD